MESRCALSNIDFDDLFLPEHQALAGHYHSELPQAGSCGRRNFDRERSGRTAKNAVVTAILGTKCDPSLLDTVGSRKEKSTTFVGNPAFVAFVPNGHRKFQSLRRPSRRRRIVPEQLGV